MDKTKRAVIIVLNFFEQIDAFEEKGETGRTGQEEDSCQHKKLICGGKAKLDA